MNKAKVDLGKIGERRSVRVQIFFKKSVHERLVALAAHQDVKLSILIHNLVVEMLPVLEKQVKKENRNQTSEIRRKPHPPASLSKKQ